MKAQPLAPVLDPAKIPEDFRPANRDQFVMAMKSWRWRLYSGFLYKIMTKEDEYQDGSIIPFKPNSAQRKFVERLHYRNIILKARQLGFTTLIAILWLDHAIFNANQRVGIIAHSLEDAAVIFRDKVRFAYKSMPKFVQDMYPLKSETKSEIEFAHNNSVIRVATSMRSGTVHRLHVSEMGKIAAKFPEKAKEIVTGSLPAVPMFGIAIIESTAEGRSGEFYDMATRAEKRSYLRRPLGNAEWRFHFFPWHALPEYRAPANDNTPVSATDHEYFDEKEKETGNFIDMQQRRWYIAKRESDMSGDAEKMWREFPTAPDECWQRSIAGTYFAPQIAWLKANGRIGKVSFVRNVPVHTFWDIGGTDGTAIWMLQYVGTQHRFPAFVEGWGLGYEHYINRLIEIGAANGIVWGNHYLPHDADHKRQFKERLISPRDMLQEVAPAWDFRIVPRVQHIQHGIELLRRKMPEAWFDEEGCKEGLEHIELYHKKWNSTLGVFVDEPEKRDGHSEAADALRQWSQGFDPAVALSNPYETLAKIRARQAG